MFSRKDLTPALIDALRKKRGGEKRGVTHQRRGERPTIGGGMNTFRLSAAILIVNLLLVAACPAQTPDDALLARERIRFICEELVLMDAALASNDLPRATAMLAHPEPGIGDVIHK